jgi:hypothetical protein
VSHSDTVCHSVTYGLLSTVIDHVGQFFFLFDIFCVRVTLCHTVKLCHSVAHVGVTLLTCITPIIVMCRWSCNVS